MVSVADERRARARATWAAGDWEAFAGLIAGVGKLVLERAGIEPKMRVLDVGTGSGGNIAIPAALHGASVVGLDPTPELLAHARRRASEAGVEVRWVEGDAETLPFEDGSFDRVISTFGAMFAPDHARAAAELVRVCADGGSVISTSWADDGFAGELFALTGAFLPAPPGEQSPALWGDERHVQELFAQAGAQASIERETVVFSFPSPELAVQHYAHGFGPFVVARSALEPQGRWQEFLDAFAELLCRFDEGGSGGAAIRSDYLLVTIER